MIWLSVASKFIKAFRSGESPGQIAAGFSIGFLIGLMPFATLQGIVLFILLILLNVNMAAGTLTVLLASLFAFLLDPIFHDIGYYILTGIPGLQGLWETLYNSPFGPLTRFNNTVVMGSMVIAIAASPLAFWLSKRGVELYRSRWAEKIQGSKAIRFARGTKVIQLYFKLRDMGS